MAWGQSKLNYCNKWNSERNCICKYHNNRFRPREWIYVEYKNFLRHTLTPCQKCTWESGNKTQTIHSRGPHKNFCFTEILKWLDNSSKTRSMVYKWPGRNKILDHQLVINGISLKIHIWKIVKSSLLKKKKKK